MRESEQLRRYRRPGYCGKRPNTCMEDGVMVLDDTSSSGPPSGFWSHHP
ncbi:hypothetical protein LINPERHAP1_LOCUS39569 [Linum perenne]